MRERRRPRHSDPFVRTQNSRRLSEVLSLDKILRDCAAPKATVENQLRLHLSLLLRSRLRTSACQIGCAIMVHYFQQSLVRPVGVFELGIKHRIDPVFPPFASQLHFEWFARFAAHGIEERGLSAL